MMEIHALMMPSSISRYELVHENIYDLGTVYDGNSCVDSQF